MKGITNPVGCVVRFGKVPAYLRTQLTQVLCYITFDIVHKFHTKKSDNDGKTCLLSLLVQTEKSSKFLIIASILSRTLNIVAESPCNPRFRSFRREKTSPR